MVERNFIGKASNARPAVKAGKASQRGCAAFTLVEVMVATAVLGILALSLFGAYSSGLAIVQSARENLRATQILMQKMEAVRLFRWTQTTNTALATPTFTDFYDPTGTNNSTSGSTYQGYFSFSPASTNVPAAYSANMQLATVTIYWTNYPGRGKAPIVRSKQMQTYVARYGMQNYVYQ